MDCTHEESVHLFLDGELPFSAQPAMFAHLAHCAACRQILHGMMDFRRMGSQEVLLVPPKADDSVLETLELSKQRQTRRDRYYERRPLWQARATLSFRTVAALAALFFVSGVLLPHEVARTQVPVIAMEQHVEQGLRGQRLELLYVLHPGLMVEATRDPDVPPHQ